MKKKKEKGALNFLFSYFQKLFFLFFFHEKKIEIKVNFLELHFSNALKMQMNLYFLSSRFLKRASCPSVVAVGPRLVVSTALSRRRWRLLSRG